MAIVNKKEITIVGSIAVVSVIAMLAIKKNADSSEPVTTDKQNVVSTDNVDYLKKIKSEVAYASEDLETIRGGIDLSKDPEKFYQAALIAERTDSWSDKSVVNLGHELRKKAVKIQKEHFPKMRKQYALNMKENLWREDIDVKLSGTTLTFTGGVFAANANIEDFHKANIEQFLRFRFKKVQYKWYSGDSEITYYKINSPDDSELKKSLY